MKTPFIAALACATLLASVAIAGPASAHDRSDRSPIGTGKPVIRTNDLLTPLSLEVDGEGVSYVSQNFAGELTQVDRNGKKTAIVRAQGKEIGAVSQRHDSVYFAEGGQEPTSAYLMVKEGTAAPKRLADLYAYEKKNNPDRINTYGFVGLSKSCAAQIPTSSPAMNRYKGIVDSHPYASLALRDGVYVADAGGNDILRVDSDGHISTVAVLPPTAPVVISKAIVTDLGLPQCVAGHKYIFEPVPTDVELGPDGWLYVTLLPGGPENDSLGARGSVVKVNPDSGKVVKVAGGFVGATGLAVSEAGNIYVAEMFGGKDGKGQVSIVRDDSKKGTKLVSLGSPAAIELRDGRLYVTTDSFVVDSKGEPRKIGKLTIVPLTKGGHSEDRPRE